MGKNPIDYKAIGLRIKFLRLKRSMTQEKLAALADLSLQHMSNVETGNTKASLPTLIKIANALSVTVDDFIM